MAKADRPNIREINKQRLRQDILDAAGRLFSAEGYQNITFRRIAEEVGYSQSALFYYFKDKEEVVKALCVQTFEGLSQISAKIVAEQPDPLARLLQMSRAYIQFGREHPHHYRLVFDPSSELIGQNRVEFIGEIGREQFSMFRQLMADCVESGAFAPGDPGVLSPAWMSAVHGLTSFLIIHAHSPWVNPPVLIDALLDRLVVGFQHGSPESRPFGL
ncbi:MAG: TetR/AcrR family transcriptional regulator [Bryobacterales bacterium]|nr:TetR/AcrR family transcriptional regulator [Bryobacterales bacterium]